MVVTLNQSEHAGEGMGRNQQGETAAHDHRDWTGAAASEMIYMTRDGGTNNGARTAGRNGRTANTR